MGTIIVDIVELNFLQQVLNGLASQAATSSRIDTAKLAVAGHSRGGKLAALQLAGSYVSPPPMAAYLVDPIDNTMFSPEGSTYPSVAKALAAAVPLRKAGISGAGISSSCNPAGTNYPRFYDALATGSWLTVLPQSTHVAFTSSLAGLLGFCGFGRTSSSETIAITAAAMTGWMQSNVRGTAVPAQLTSYLNSKVQAGTITFAVKP
uniref:Chlorophyllase n=1 Tax=Tetradesmus obliquus TaxID=3088 RepID=A0A383VFI1_TETOB|eukprot:jgi/Sobl393_1/17764/SZX63146.1